MRISFPARHFAEAYRLSTTNVGFLIAGMGLLGALGMIFNAAHSDRTGERYWHALVPFVIIAAGYVVAGLSVRGWLAVPALLVTVVSYSALQGPQLAIPSTFLKGKSMAAGIAAMNTLGMLGGFIGPYWMGLAKDFTGDYQRGLLTLTVPNLIAAAILLHMRRNSIRRPSGGIAIGRVGPKAPPSPGRKTLNLCSCGKTT